MRDATRRKYACLASEIAAGAAHIALQLLHPCLPACTAACAGQQQNGCKDFQQNAVSTHRLRAERRNSPLWPPLRLLPCLVSAHSAGISKCCYALVSVNAKKHQVVSRYRNFAVAAICFAMLRAVGMIVTANRM